MANSSLQGSFISSDHCCWLFDFLAFESRDRCSSQFSLVTLPVSVWRSGTLEISDNWRPRKAFVVYIQKFEDDMIKLSVNKTKCTGLDLDSLDFDLNIWFRPEKLPVLQWYGHPHVLGIPIPKTLVIWVFSSHITFPIWVSDRVRVTGDAHITRVWEWGCPYHCNTGTFEKRGGARQWACLQNPSWRQQTRLSSFRTVHIFSAFCKPLSWIVGTAAWYFIISL